MTDQPTSASDLLREIRRLRDDLDTLTAKQTVELVEHTARIKTEILDEWTQHNTGPDTKKVYDDVQSWVEGWFVHAYARSSAGWGHWCPEWWRHREAVSRLTALWQSWEAAQKNTATGMAHWYVMYADPIFGHLTASHGVFASCKDEHIRLLPSLATITVEAGYPHTP